MTDYEYYLVKKAYLKKRARADDDPEIEALRRRLAEAEADLHNTVDAQPDAERASAYRDMYFNARKDARDAQDYMASTYGPGGPSEILSGIGGAVGAGLGYAGSNWVSNKLGLQNPNASKWQRYGDAALRTVGTLGGAYLGAVKGHRFLDWKERNTMPAKSHIDRKLDAIINSAE